MTPSRLLEALWLALLLAAVGFTVRAERREPTPRVEPATRLSASPYRRIASGSIVGDQLLLALAEPERIVALSSYGRARTASPHLYGRRPTLAGLTPLESLLALRVDLVLVSQISAGAELARARSAGVRVFDLGPMRGLATLLPNITSVATLLGDPARGQRHAAELTRRMRAVAADIAPERRRRALYVSAHGGKLFGGAAGTSYHDVLAHAGLVDVAAARFRDWPQYDPEQLLALDPELVVTSQGLGAGLCAVSGLERLRACRTERGIIELPEALLGDPGPRMLDAAEALREAVYGPVPSRGAR
jgi:iron complex transport system substrate-binding protein